MLAHLGRLYIGVCEACNLTCRHCFAPPGMTLDGTLSRAEVLGVARDARDHLGATEVQITGGEPTCRTDLVSVIADIQRLGLITLVQTNGVLEPQCLAELMKMPRELTRFVISLDGFEANDALRGEESTRRTVEVVRTLAPRYPVRINTLLTSLLTWEEVSRLADLALDVGVAIAFNPVCPTGRADADMMMEPDVYLTWMRKLEGLRERGVEVRKCFDVEDGLLRERAGCPVRNAAAAGVAADGAVYPCGFMANWPQWRMGSVRHTPLSELVAFVPEPCRGVPTACRNCSYFVERRCHAGCPARIYAVNRTFDAPDPYCLAAYRSKHGSEP